MMKGSNADVLVNVDKYWSVTMIMLYPTTITNPIKLKEHLKNVRKQGFSYSYEDITIGVAAVGCPVVSSTGDAIAAISVAGPVSNFSEERIPFLLNLIKNATDEISGLLQV